jgi:hypothetical protein
MSKCAVPVRRDGAKVAETRLSIGELLAVIAAVLAAALAVLTDLTKDWPPLARWSFFAALFLFFIMWPYYYFYVLAWSGGAAGSDENAEYLKFREGLKTGGSFDRAYVGALGWALDRVDVFFGDVGRDNPTWTAASYDRCLLLALVYPLAAMFAIWVASGQVGVAERAIGLPDGEAWFLRGSFAASTVVLIFVVSRAIWAEGLRAMIFWTVGGAFAVAVAGAVAGVGAVAGAGAVTVAVAGSVAGAVAVAVAGAGAVAFAVDYGKRHHRLVS